MREPDWMLASVVVLGFIALVLACVDMNLHTMRAIAHPMMRGGLALAYGTSLALSAPCRSCSS